MRSGTSLHRARTGFWPQAVFLLSALFASRLVWYDLRIVRRELLEPGRMRTFFLIYAASMAPVVLLILGRSLTRALFAKPVWWVVLIAWYGLLPALAYGNDTVFIAQDLFKLSLFPAGYLGGRLVFRATDEAAPSRALHFCSRLAFCVLAFQAIRFALLCALKRAGTGFLYGTVLDVLPATTFAAIAATGRRGERLLALAAAGLSLALTVPGQKRTVLGCLALSGIVVLFKTMARRPVLVLSVAYLASLAIAGALLLGGIDATVESDAFKRLTTTEVSTAVGTESWRFFELRIVAEHLDEGGPLAWLFGYGHGASFEIWHPARGLQVVHSVHHTPGAMVFRYGLAGLLFYGALAVHVLRAVSRSERCGRREGIAATLAAKAYLLASLVASLVIFGFVDDVLVGVFLAVLHAVDRPDQAREQRS